MGAGSLDSAGMPLSRSMGLNEGSFETLLPQVFKRRRLRCCLCLPMQTAIRMIVLYEQYHFFTVYQSVFFLFGFKQRVSSLTFTIFLLVFIYCLGVLFYADYRFARYLMAPEDPI